MGFRFIGHEIGRKPPAGVPGRDLSDDEILEIEERMPGFIDGVELGDTDTGGTPVFVRMTSEEDAIAFPRDDEEA